MCIRKNINCVCVSYSFGYLFNLIHRLVDVDFSTSCERVSKAQLHTSSFRTSLIVYFKCLSLKMPTGNLFREL